MCRNMCQIVAYNHAYVMWAELDQRHFLSAIVPAGNSTGTKKNFFKCKCVLGLEFSIKSSVYCATIVAKVSVFSNWTRSTVSF